MAPAAGGDVPTDRPRARARPGWWIAPAAWMGLIFASSCTVIDRSTFVDAVSRVLPTTEADRAFGTFYFAFGILLVKGWHATEYALLFLLLRQGIERGFRWPLRRSVPPALAGCLLFAASDEWHQTFVPNRGGTWVDVLFDFGGSLAAASVLLLLARARGRKPADGHGEPEAG